MGLYTQKAISWPKLPFSVIGIVSIIVWTLSMSWMAAIRFIIWSQGTLWVHQCNAIAQWTALNKVLASFCLGGGPLVGHQKTFGMSGSVASPVISATLEDTFCQIDLIDPQFQKMCKRVPLSGQPMKQDSDCGIKPVRFLKVYNTTLYEA